MIHNIAAVLFDQAGVRPDATAVRDLPTGREISYEHLALHVGRVAAGFQTLGLAPGDRVAILLRNCPAYLEVFFGALTAGLVVVPLNTRLPVTDLAHMLEDSGARVLVSEPAFRAIVDDHAIQVPHTVDVTGTSFGLSLADLAEADPLRHPHTRRATDLCSLMYTSGTTGMPKAVMLSHEAWASVATTARNLLPFNVGAPILHAAPLTHGAGFLVLPTLQTGGVNVTAPSFDPTATAGLIASGQVEGLFLVPSMIRMLLDALPATWTPSERFRWLYYAGSPIDKATFLEAAQAFDCRLVQSFAQMEAPMFLTSLGMEDHRQALADPNSTIVQSAGRIISDRKVRIVGPSGADVPPGHIGEITARAPQRMLGYWNREVESQATIHDGWLRTGDLGKFDPAGYLHVVDRVKDMIISGGSNIYAREVEDVLVDAPGVGEVAVIGLPHRVWGEQVTAVLVPESEQSVDPETIMRHCRERLPGYKVPKAVIAVRSLPRNPYGKVLKRQLRNELLVGSLSESSGAMGRSGAEEAQPTGAFLGSPDPMGE